MGDQCRHPLDYGRDGEYPPKLFVPNPYGQEVPQTILECLQADPWSPSIWGEYQPSDIVWWLSASKSEDDGKASATSHASAVAVKPTTEREQDVVNEAGSDKVPSRTRISQSRLRHRGKLRRF